MSDQIFCEIDNVLLDVIKQEAKGRLIIDCGCGRGLLGSKYDGKIRSIDMYLPDKPLTNIIEGNCVNYCFPKNCLPIFIRPCHGGFVDMVISNNLEKFNDVLYISKPSNEEVDLSKTWYDYQIISDWIGNEGERIYRLSVKKETGYKFLTGRIVYLADLMLSMMSQTVHDEFNDVIMSPFKSSNISIDGMNLRMKDHYDSDKAYDYLFFDWGGMSIGNSILETYCDYLVEDAKNNPSKLYIMVSTITSYAMKDALDKFGSPLPNMFFNINDFIEYIKPQL